MINALKNIGKWIWITIGIGFVIILVSWLSYAFGNNGLGSIIMLVLSIIIGLVFVVYLIITLIFFLIKKIRNKKRK